MKKLTILFVSITITSFCYAQKAEVKNGQVFSDGTAIAKIEKEGCTAFASTCSFYIKSLNDAPLITVVAMEMNDPAEVSVADADGKVRYLRYSFTGISGFAETKNPSMLMTKPKDVIQSVVKAGLIKDGKLDEAAVINFINANGQRYTQRQKDLNPQIIIIERN